MIHLLAFWAEVLLVEQIISEVIIEVQVHLTSAIKSSFKPTEFALPVDFINILNID